MPRFDSYTATKKCLPEQCKQGKLSSIFNYIHVFFKDKNKKCTSVILPVLELIVCLILHKVHSYILLLKFVPRLFFVYVEFIVWIYFNIDYCCNLNKMTFSKTNLKTFKITLKYIIVSAKCRPFYWCIMN